MLLYIHGFDNLPERDVFERAGTLQSLCDATAEPGLVQVVPMLWPCDNDRGLLKGYWDDRNAADAGAVGFRRAFGKFPSWRDRQDPDNPCLKRIHVLAHSMGARVLFTHPMHAVATAACPAGGMGFAFHESGAGAERATGNPRY